MAPFSPLFFFFFPLSFGMLVLLSFLFFLSFLPPVALSSLLPSFLSSFLSSVLKYACTSFASLLFMSYVRNNDLCPCSIAMTNQGCVFWTVVARLPLLSFELTKCKNDRRETSTGDLQLSSLFVQRPILISVSQPSFLLFPSSSRFN